MSASTGDPELARAESIARELELLHPGPDPAAWASSAFGWILTRPPATKGAVAAKLVQRWCESHGIDVTRSPDSDADRLIAGLRTEVKMSTPWPDGAFRFQQIRDQNYHQVFCVGLEPSRVSAWLIPKAAALADATPQHGGVRGTETRWIIADASNPPAWLAPYGGSLGSVLGLLRAQERLD